MWNHLIESASHATGSLLIWDTGEYSIVTKEQPKGPETDEEDLESTQGDDPDGVPEHEKLIAAFKQGSIRIRLRGSRLPQNYTISLRLSTLSKNQANFPKRHTPRKRHRKEGVIPPPTGAEDTVDSDSDLGTRSPRILSSPNLTSSSPLNTSAGIADASEDSSEETSIIRTNNAYTGATNSIGSIHRRQWFLTLDKANSGFVEVRTASGKKWTGGFEPFVVGGAEVERSVVTGRLCKDIMADEGVMGFVSRKNWKALVD
ncbi:hypothetical protein M501DRAFT_1001295 [Patellaria atrata CBS 101060]|uniref:DNA ligase D 3'-phosphoesterase domain-containing protein n=1 Tax=Patellaria atrata CBS 101060 TaxID=1346257 RepID=A0A9P4VKC0_9PEZI|nr:hypothetical protein M501DRAFT_1001295 [Patellaria atrata CBS 101060]